jgi:hypothetical protein
MAFLIQQQGLFLCVGQPMNAEGVGPENIAFKFAMVDDTGVKNRYEFTAGRAESDARTCAVFIDALLAQGNGSVARLPLVIAGVQFGQSNTMMPEMAQDALKTLRAVIGEYSAPRMVASDNVKVFQRAGESATDLMARIERLKRFLTEMFGMLIKELDTPIKHGKGLKIH